ncbi:MAG TPA: ammonia-forming cytochrome c nitrite reductase [Bacteroidetes bacterium]|nr:ammonia-forming cytochrome c nitrite reductase [Bacteroidota bacterium]
MKSIRNITEKKPWVGWFLFCLTVVVVFLLGLLAASIVERRAEAVFAYTPQVDIREFEPRNEIWGQNFPREYQSYLQTADTSFRSRHNGSAFIDMLEVDPRLVVLWAGYSFSKEYNQGRGHYYAVQDIHEILRTGGPTAPGEGPMPNTCWTCKSPDVPRVMSEVGVEEFYRGAWASRGPQIVNFIGCADCHDPETMNLRITRPALLEAYERMGKDIGRASHQEMRSLVCAQCHVEYYFRGEGNYLTFPWDNGFSAEEMEAYYDGYGFADWTHALSRAPMLKAQHPDYEVYMTGIHADRGVACADCHMPYKSEGGVKFTDHHIQSSLNNVASSCQVCHREETEKLVANVYRRQEQILENRDQLERLLVRAHVEAAEAWKLGATEDEMEDILTGIRHAQWRWDYAAATHGGSFHSPVELSRLIGTAIDRVQETRIGLARLLLKKGYEGEVPYPDLSTKARAQALVGLDMKALNEEKQYFLENIVPAWLQQAAEREAGWGK